jgi:glycosyltransferase involved in cell wall biosynthesis
MLNPLISIIIPNFNRSNYIEQTLQCVLEQTYTNWECIIIDDGSLDNSVAIINSFIEKDVRFKLINRPLERNKGASTCRNIGIENANGDFIQFLDSDDIMSENKLEQQVLTITDFDKKNICTCKWSRFTKIPGDSVSFESLDSYNDFDDISAFLKALTLSKGYFPIHAYLIKKSIIDKAGLWNEYLSLNDDSEFLIRLFCNTDKIYFAQNSTVYYRWTSSENVSSYNNYQKVNDAIHSWKLIEMVLKIRFKNQKINYVEIMKKGLYVNVEKSFPALIKEHKGFFKKQLEEKQLVFRVRKKIINIFRKLWNPLY